jgi:hypothetical protein
MMLVLTGRSAWTGEPDHLDWFENWSDNTVSTVGSFEAKTHFAELLGRAEKGEEITITRRQAGRPPGPSRAWP